MPSYWDKFPDDVKTLIYQMNPEHRQLFNSLSRELKLKAALCRLNNVYSLWVIDLKKFVNKFHIPIYIFFQRYIDDPDHIIRQLNSCECCVRHTQNKPKYLMDNYVPQKVYKKPGFFARKKVCKCYCRGFSRRIYEAFDEQNSFLVHDDYRSSS